MKAATIAGLLLCPFSMPLVAQSVPPAPSPAAPAAPPCSRAEHRQFDFWIGDWDVADPKGAAAGTNLIRPVLNGCVLHESWKGKGGFVGESVNAYDARRGRWHQTWTDATGGVLMLEGAFENGVMTLSDKDLPGKKDVNTINEISWTPNGDGSVRQHWRVTKDGGKTWTTSFDGKYVRAARPQPPAAR
ncbi:MAG: hypothetical protein JNK75_00965 [Betaproteobacteria bacterium]|nr:hypothetical protein [Betaproteobacteria bacterium]